MTDNVVIYLTPSCPYCIRAKMLLDQKDIPYKELRVDLDTTIQSEMVQRSNRFTVPQIFIGQTHIGGFDDMALLEMNNELDPLLFPSEA